jgi:AcrR family transcriptional regulator
MSVRRGAIVEIAKGLFAQKGYRTTSMRDIALASDLLAGSLYSHFRSKAHLLELAILPFYDELIPEQQAALDLDVPGADRMRDMVRRVLAVCAAHDAELTILHYDWSHLVEIDELADLVGRSNETLDLWEQVIAVGVADGSLRPSVSAETTVRVITSSIHGVLDRRRFGTLKTARADHDVQALADELVTALVDGLATA